MAIVVDPTFTPPPPPAVVTSPDGTLTARVDAAHAGVLLTANYSADPSVAKVRFHRGDGTTVRSGDTAWAPGGWANAYDHEAPLGVGVSWYAVPIGFDGTEGAPSALVAAEVPVSGTGVWVKSILDPESSMLLRLLRDGSMVVSRAARNTLSDVPGSPFGVASWDVRRAREWPLAVHLDQPGQRAALEALMDSGPLLVQTAPETEFADMYALPGDLSVEWRVASSVPLLAATLPLTEIARPATLDAPLMIPGRSYDQVAAGYASYDDLAAQVASYNALLGA